jgi:hypothetical protein
VAEPSPVVLTIDVDWAPDSMVEALADRLEAHAVPATWFVTHGSPALDRLRERPELFELGVHPNFRSGSTHGASVGEVLDHVMTLVPEAVSARSHGVLQSGDLLAELVRRTPVRIDSTTFLPDMRAVRPVPQHTPHGVLVRVPFVWSDDYEPLRPHPAWSADRLLAGGGVRVVLFHPVHVCRDARPAAAFAALVERLAENGRARRLRDAAGTT